MVLVDFCINTEFRHSSDSGVKLLANLVGKELHLLVLDAGSLGICGQLLHLAAVVAVFLVFLFVGALGPMFVSR